MENSIQKIICGNCGSNALPWGEKNSFKLFQCEKCRLVFVNPLPDPASVYGEDYFLGATEGFGYVDYDKDKEPMVATFNRYLDMFAQYGAAEGKLFDIGAATGFFLDLARVRGYDVSGVEMSAYATEIAKKKGIDVTVGDLMQLDVAGGAYDVVTMLDVLEHMTDPFSELREVGRMLRAGGILAINAPNGESLLARILKTAWHLVVPPEHLFYFSPQNLGEYLRKEGFEIVYSGTIGKQFTIAYIFKTLYKWQKFAWWNKAAEYFSEPSRASWSIPLNLFDNFFLIAKKKG